jgi:opacity protein-like surface antigen
MPKISLWKRRVTMKKLLCTAMILIAALPLAFSQGKTITVRAFMPIDFGGTYKWSYSGGSTDVDTNMGFGLGGEAMIGVVDRMKLGLGIQFLINRGYDQSGNDATFGFVPIYGLVTYDFNLRVIDPYLIGRIGYNFHKGNDDYTNNGDVDLKGGVIFALGGGASFKIPSTPLHAFLELDYAYNGGKKDDTDISYRRLQGLIGVSFSL